MSIRKDEKRPIGPEEARELLPWYLTGRLSHTEMRGVEGVLKGSADLREQLEAVRQQRSAVIDSTDAIGTPSAGALTRLLQQIETTRQRRLVVATEPNMLERLLGPWFSARPALQFAFIAACLVIVAQGIFLVRLGERPAAVEGLPVASVTTAPEAAATLLVSFRPDVSAAQFAQMLAEIKATVIDGPKPGQTFVLALGSAQAADAAVARLQSRPDLVASVQRH